MDRAERTFLIGASAIIAVVAAFLGFQVWTHPPQGAPAEESPPPQAPPPPSPEPPRRIVVSGRAVDLPGLPIDAAILHRTRIVLVSEDREIGEAVVPDDDGRFRVEGEAILRGLRLRISTDLQLPLFDRSLDRRARREIPIAAERVEVGELPLPRVEEFGSIRGEVVDAEGRPLRHRYVEMDAVEGTSTPDIGLARLGGVLDHAANAPVLYREGSRFTILHVPPGQYWLRVEALGRRVPPVRVEVGRGEARARIAESACRRRLLGSVRDAENRHPLPDAEIWITTAGFAGPATRDPWRVMGRASFDGLYDLPLPDTLPAGGLTVSIRQERYQGSDFLLRERDVGPDGPVRRDLDLGRE